MKFQPEQTRSAMENLASQTALAGAPPVLTDLIIRLAYVSGLKNEAVSALLLKPYAQGFISSLDVKNISQHFPFLQQVAPSLDLVGYTIALLVAHLKIEVSYAQGAVIPQQIMANVIASYH